VLQVGQGSGVFDVHCLAITHNYTQLHTITHNYTPLHTITHALKSKALRRLHSLSSNYSSVLIHKQWFVFYKTIKLMERYNQNMRRCASLTTTLRYLLQQAIISLNWNYTRETKKTEITWFPYLCAEVLVHFQDCLTSVRVVMNELVALETSEVQRMPLSPSHDTNAQRTHQKFLRYWESSTTQKIVLVIVSDISIKGSSCQYW
jgi:hypothetical protein